MTECLGCLDEKVDLRQLACQHRLRLSCEGPIARRLDKVALKSVKNCKTIM